MAVVGLLLAGCMTVPPPVESKLQSITPGMSRSSVIASLGQPTTREMKATGEEAGIEKLHCRGKTLSSDSLGGYMNYQRTVLLKNGVVVGFDSRDWR